MRTISGLIMNVEPYDCPAGFIVANCMDCIHRLGRITVNPTGDVTVRCCWEEDKEDEE